MALARIESTAVVNAVNYASLGSRDALIVKMSGGTWVTDWATQFGGTGNDYFSSVEIDADNRVYTAGSIGAVVNLGSAGTFTPAVNSSSNGLVVGLDDDGSIAWAKQSVSASQGFSGLYNGVAVAGNTVYAGGSMGTTQTLSDGVTAVGNAWNCCNGYSAGYVVKINASPVGGSVLVNNVVAQDPNMIAVTNIAPRIVDETASESKLILSGRNLDKVTSVLQSKMSLKHKILENGNLEIELPTLSIGTHDIVLTGLGFHYTLQNAYRVQSVQNISISKFTSTKQASATSKALKATISKLQTKANTTCLLSLNNKVTAKLAKTMSNQARNFCNELHVNFQFRVERTAEATKLALQVRGW